MFDSSSILSLKLEIWFQFVVALDDDKYVQDDIKILYCVSGYLKTAWSLSSNETLLPEQNDHAIRKRPSIIKNKINFLQQ